MKLHKEYAITYKNALEYNYKHGTNNKFKKKKRTINNTNLPNIQQKMNS